MIREKKVEQYDVVIIGGGASGLTAGIYCGRARLNTLIIEQALIGGLATSTSEIENYPGFPEGVSGKELMEFFHKQAKNFGVKFKLTDVKNVELDKDIKIVETFRNIYEAKTVIIANGSKPRITGATNEQQYLGRGIAFCATCDAASNTGKVVTVIGSGDAAIEEGIFLTKFADKVIVSVIHDEGIMDCNEIAKAAALENPKMEFLWNTVVDSFEGEEQLKSVVFRNLKTKELIKVDCATCFEFIGYLPNTDVYKDKVSMTNRGYIVTNEEMETNIPGVFAAGDVRDKYLRQVATCVGDAAIAGVKAEKYIAESEVFEAQIMSKDSISYIYNAIDQSSREFLSTIEELEKDYTNYKFNKVDVYKSKGIATRLGVTTCPSIVVIKDRKIVNVISDDITKESIIKLL